MRTAEIKRKTNETDVLIKLNLDVCDQVKINSGSGFLDHMLTLFASHAGYGLTVECKGDTYVDMHHSVEDIGITLGQALTKALGEKKGINRYGCICLPMDETLVSVALDISGRSLLNFDVEFPNEYKVGDLDVELVEEFFLGFVRNANITLHITKRYGKNVHHIIEAIFKGFGRALKQATAINANSKDVLPSTKGVL